MKYGYTIKKDGVLYPAGTEVPVGTVSKEEVRQLGTEAAEIAEPQPKGSKNSKKA